MNKGFTTSGGIITAVIALVIGGFVGYGISMHTDNPDGRTTTTSQTAPDTTTKAAGLRVGLNNVLREHVSSSLDVTRAIVDNSTNLQATLDAQTANAVDVAKAVGSVYGDKAQATITPLFVDHITQSNNYAKAVAAGDNSAKQAALTELQDYLHKISAFFSGAIKDLPADTVYTVLNTHEMLINQATEAYASGDFAKSYQIERDALAQIGTVADVLSKGIVATVPDKF